MSLFYAHDLRPGSVLLARKSDASWTWLIIVGVTWLSGVRFRITYVIHYSHHVRPRICVAMYNVGDVFVNDCLSLEPT